MLAHSENRHRRAAASKIMKTMLSLKSSKAVSNQFRETLPLLDLNLTGLLASVPYRSVMSS